MSKNKVWSIFGTGAEVIIYLVVMGFLFTESMNFFYFAFPPEQQNVAWLGLGLTGGGMIAYFVILKSGRADTDLKKAITLSMIVLCTLGELATAGYGTQIESLKNAGLAITADGIKTFVLVIRILGLVHAVAMIGFLGGDDIAAIFEDKDKNGIPDRFERGKGQQNNQPRQHPDNTPQPIRNNGQHSYSTDTPVVSLDPTQADGK